MHSPPRHWCSNMGTLHWCKLSTEASLCKPTVLDCWLHSWTSFLASLTRERPPLWPSLNHFFCDVKPLLEVACGNTVLNQWLSVVTGSVSMGAFLLTLLSYIYIISFLLFKNWSCRMLQKALSTCASHFMVVCLFYGPVGFTYICPASTSSMSEDRMVAIIYSAVTPVLNPLIYTLRNKEVMLALRKTFGRKLFKDSQLH